jgi:uncharacterized membrane protein SirB2
MIAWYLQVKWVHVAAVLSSGLLFLLRGLLVQLSPRAGLSAGALPARWAMAAPVRYVAYAVDTVLLTAALMLATMLPAAVFANGWLVAKLSLLVFDVGFGTLALKRGQTPAVRRASFAAALLVFACMVATARTHLPFAGLFAG